MIFCFEVNSFCKISEVVIIPLVPKEAMCSSCSEIFTFNTKLPIMAMLAEKEILKKKLPPVGLDLMIIGSRVKCLSY